MVADSLSKKNQVLGSKCTLVQKVMNIARRCWLVTVDLFATALSTGFQYTFLWPVTFYFCDDVDITV